MDALNCAHGCLLTPAQRLKQLNKQFSHLDLNDYLCDYTDCSTQCSYSVPTQKELDTIFTEMNKTSAKDRHIDCSCCGYETCEEMATAIYNGYNYKENCIHYIKDQVEVERNNALQLAEEVNQEKQIIEKQQETIIHTVEEINKRFAVVADEISKLASSSRETANKSNEFQDRILEAIDKIQNDAQNLSEIIREINEKTSNLAAASEEIAASNDVILETTKNVKDNLGVLTALK